MSEPEKLRKFFEGTIVKTVSEEIKTEKKVATGQFHNILWYIHL